MKVMDNEKKKLFLLEVFNFFAEIHAGWYIMSVNKELMCIVKDSALQSSTRFLKHEAFVAARKVVDDIADKFHPIPNNSIVYEDFRLIIHHRKEIHKKVSDYLETKISKHAANIDEIEYIKRLLPNEKVIYVLQTSPLLQRCYYLLNVEKIIHLTGHTTSINKHRKLLRWLDLEEIYSKLFPPFVDVKTHLTHNTLPQLPEVLITIIAEYCRFYWPKNSEDTREEDELFERLLLLQ